MIKNIHFGAVPLVSSWLRFDIRLLKKMKLAIVYVFGMFAAGVVTIQFIHWIARRVNGRMHENLTIQNFPLYNFFLPFGMIVKVRVRSHTVSRSFIFLFIFGFDSPVLWFGSTNDVCVQKMRDSSVYMSAYA